MAKKLTKMQDILQSQKAPYYVKSGATPSTTRFGATPDSALPAFYAPTFWAPGIAARIVHIALWNTVTDYGNGWRTYVGVEINKDNQMADNKSTAALFFRYREKWSCVLPAKKFHLITVDGANTFAFGRRRDELIARCVAEVGLSPGNEHDRRAFIKALDAAINLIVDRLGNPNVIHALSEEVKYQQAEMGYSNMTEIPLSKDGKDAGKATIDFAGRTRGVNIRVADNDE